MGKRIKRGRVRAAIRRLLKTVSVYLDDMLALAAGGCFVEAAYDLFGGGVAKAVAGVCLLGYAVVVARAGRQGDRS